VWDNNLEYLVEGFPFLVQIKSRQSIKNGLMFAFEISFSRKKLIIDDLV